jgi:IS605 OrfB family transposase
MGGGSLSQFLSFGAFNAVTLHHMTYRAVRAATGLPSNLTCSARSVVAEAYKREPKPMRQHTWKPTAGVRYDARTLTVKVEARHATLTTLQGRVRASLVISDYHRQYFDGAWQIAGTAMLTSRRGVWYLHLVCTREVPDSTDPGVLAVDAGIQRIAFTSGGTSHNGGVISQIRRRRFRQRRSLQAGHKSRGQRRLLKRLAEREHRAVEWKMWSVANAIVREAMAAQGGTIAVEDLTHIRTRIRSAKKQRLIQQGWPFASLQAKIAHVASRNGIALEWVDARYTSQTCNRCGHCEKANRPNQSTFCCVSCGHTLNADFMASLNMQARCVASGCAACRPALVALQELPNTRPVEAPARRKAG